jgi:hypothetical protein
LEGLRMEQEVVLAAVMQEVGAAGAVLPGVSAA